MGDPKKQIDPVDHQASELEIAELYSHGEEMETSENGETSQPPAPTGMEDLPGGTVLNSLLKIAPFSAYMVHRAKLEYQHNTIQGRFRKYVKDHKYVNAFCTFMDLLVRMIIVFIVLVVLVVFLSKALLPLPEWPF